MRKEEIQNGKMRWGDGWTDRATTRDAAFVYWLLSFCYPMMWMVRHAFWSWITQSAGYPHQHWFCFCAMWLQRNCTAFYRSFEKKQMAAQSHSTRCSSISCICWKCFRLFCVLTSLWQWIHWSMVLWWDDHKLFINILTTRNGTVCESGVLHSFFHS